MLNSKNEDWEKKLLEKIATSSIREQKTARRWNVFFKFLFFIYLFSLLALYLPSDLLDDGKLSISKKHTAVIDVNGIILDGAEASADNIISSLKKVYKAKDVEGIILRINSPGGSPVQSAYVYNEIRRLRKEHEDIPIYAVISDIGASGGYYIAVAADKIYANPSSMVGSVGVLMDGFGFVDTMKTLGVERRLLTAGSNKGFMDPFSPQKENETQHMKVLLKQVHAQFIKAVKEGRGDRLKGDEDVLFSGLVWSGEEGLKLGIIDGFGSTASIARDVVKQEKMIDYTATTDLVERLADKLGASVGKYVFEALGLGASIKLK